MLHRTLWLTGAAVVAVCAGTVVAAHWASADPSQELAEHSRTLADIELRLAPLVESAEADLVEGPQRVQHAIDEMRRRVEALERAPRRVPAANPSVETLEAAARAAAEATATVGEDERPSSSALAAELEGLLDRVLGPNFDIGGSPQDQERFWELVKGTHVVDERIEALEELVSANPGDVGLRMSLADTYIAKLFSVPGGPEQGRWGSKAEREWRAVVELDPEQWEAQFAVANSLSYYPDVMGRTGEAIEGLERARELQEQLEPSKHHVQTYLSLSQLYLRSGKNDRAREALEAGLRYHPGNDQLMAALIQLEGR